MAKDVITRFKLETTQYDSKLRDASKSLSEYSRTASNAGNEFDKFTKKNVEAARALGNMSPSATNAKDKVKELVGAFNDVARAYNALTQKQQQSDFGKAMAQSLTQLQQKIRETKQEMHGLSAPGAQGGDGFLSGISGKMGGMLQVFGGNLMTKGVEMLSGLASEIGDMVNQSVQLAKEGEGIRIAFERLGRGDLLDGLRQATHGTVTDIELMKAAVKFNDFKLPVEELGTMLAFAQQKAKDTGQSVDYMVDSIVTGLGRKSLMILDNLGLSAAEIKEEMKKTGDMTTAVGAIIRKQMSEAGDYVETAADKAAQADVELKNSMEELGRTFAPLAEAGSSLWNSLEIGAINLLNKAVRPLIDALTTAGRLRKSMNDQLGTDSSTQFVNKQLSALAGSKHKNFRYNASMKYYNEEISWRTQYAKDIRAWQSGQRGDALSSRIRSGQKRAGTDFLDASLMERQANEFRKMQADFKNRAQAILNPQKKTPDSLPDDSKTPKPRSSSHTTTTPAAELTEEQKIQKQINDLVQEGMTMDEKARTVQREKIAALQTQLEGYKKIKDELLGIEKKEKEVKPEKPTYTQAFSQGAVSMPSIQAYVSGLQSEIANTDIGCDLFNNLTEKMADAGRMSEVLKSAMESGVQGVDLTSIAQEMKAKLLEGDISDEDWQAFLDKINEKIDNSELKLKIDVDTKGIITSADEQKKLAAQTQKAWNMAAQSVGNLSTALNSIEDPAAKAAGTVIKAIADIALGFAQASVQAGAMGPWGWVAWLAAGTAALATTISTVHSLTGLANGGIVPGNSLSGDNVYGGGAMVNSGEVVLNKAQQGNLASQLTDSAVQGFGGQPYVEGEKIFLGMNNSSRRMGRGEIVTTQTLRRMGLTR